MEILDILNTSVAMVFSTATPSSAADLIIRLQEVRRLSELLIKPLEPEDLSLQGMEEASPPKWHLAHTTWFFESFVLRPGLPGFKAADLRWDFLFNSYYESLGKCYPRSQRSLLSRPTILEIFDWRRRVDVSLIQLLQCMDLSAEKRALVELGLHHEQQHQELLLMDLLDGFSRQPLEPVYQFNWREPDLVEGLPTWLNCDGGLVTVGTSSGFHFDNEEPPHRVWLEPFVLSDRLVTNSDYAHFITDNGYHRPELWMSEGWSICQQRCWQAPCYWRRDNDCSSWSWEFTLAGRCPLDPDAPVRHLSWFEADAYARWADARLPLEEEWERAICQHADGLRQAHGVLWQWTSSPYRPYTKYNPAAGAIGEYNGKFMTSQFVLRGSSALTPAGHARNTYRNFFPPASRWVAAGIRLAKHYSG